MVDTGDLKSPASRLAGSSPAPGILFRANFRAIFRAGFRANLCADYGG